MPLTHIKQPFMALERDFTLLHVTLTVGSTGAVSAVSGRGFANGAASGELGGIARSSEAVYVVTLPGTGALQEIVPFAPVILDGDAGDARHALVTARSLSARTVTFTFLDLDTPAASELTSGSVVEFVFLVRDKTVS